MSISRAPQRGTAAVRQQKGGGGGGGAAAVAEGRRRRRGGYICLAANQVATYQWGERLSGEG